eukprot:4146995-Pyramimonas_sp.AAC.3
MGRKVQLGTNRKHIVNKAALERDGSTVRRTELQPRVGSECVTKNNNHRDHFEEFMLFVIARTPPQLFDLHRTRGMNGRTAHSGWNDSDKAENNFDITVCQDLMQSANKVRTVTVTVTDTDCDHGCANHLGAKQQAANKKREVDAPMLRWFGQRGPIVKHCVIPGREMLGLRLSCLP